MDVNGKELIVMDWTEELERAVFAIIFCLAVTILFGQFASLNTAEPEKRPAVFEVVRGV